MTSPKPHTHFAEVTEATGTPLSRDGASMMATRYLRAAELARGRRVLELACGSGPGLGLLASSARFVVGADIDSTLLERARRHYEERIPLVRMSAEHLPFADASFDVVLFLEATYYVPDMDSAFREIARVLAPGGRVLFVNANPERPDFIRSPHSRHYHSADEFVAALRAAGLTATAAGAFPVRSERGGLASRSVRTVLPYARRTLEGLGLVPKTLAGRARLKRLVFGPLITLPAEIDGGFAPRSEIVPQSAGPVRDYKVIYVEGAKA